MISAVASDGLDFLKPWQFNTDLSPELAVETDEDEACVSHVFRIDSNLWCAACMGLDRRLLPILLDLWSTYGQLRWPDYMKRIEAAMQPSQ
jgi:hypothetical protein